MTIQYSPEQQKIADEVIALEKMALDKWFKGDTSGYREIWSQNNFTYFDIANPKRIENYAQACEFLDGVEGKLFAESYDFQNPRVQFSQGNDTAILTYQLFADTNVIDMRYNCIEIYQKEPTGWKVIHSCWSAIRPMDWDFGKVKEEI